MGIAAAYIRVSSKAADYATQRHAIEECAGQRGDTITLWREEKQSGKTVKRPVLDDLRARVRLGTVERVYAFKLDRITRSGVADTFEVVEEMRRNKCELICVKDNFRFDDSPGADAVIFALSLGAKLERSAVADRISAARDRLKKQGRPWGRPRRGYTKKDRAGGVKPLDVKRARQLHQQGRSVRAIAAALGVPKATVHRAVRGAREAQAVRP